MTPTSLFAIGGQTIGPLGVAILLFHLYRTFKTRFVLQWAIAFSCLAVFRGATAAIIARAEAGGREVPLVLLSMVGSGAACLQLGFFIWGCMEVTRRRIIAARDAQRVLALLAVAGAVAGTLPFLLGTDPAIHRFFNLGLHAFAASATFVFCGIAIRRVRGHGFTVATGALLLYGLAELVAFVTVMRGLMAHAAPLPLDQLGVLDLIASAIVALGLVLTVLEDQREATNAASSQVERLAYYDTVTGLPNRALFGDRLGVALAHAQRHKYKVAVLFLDIDRFKQINDSLGHSVGDRLLRAAAERIRGTIREEDTVARFGGDEFTILIHIVGRIEDAGRIAQKILDSFKTPIVIDSREFVVTSSIGISIYPVDGVDGETLIRNADTSMYRAKDVGRNTYQFYAAAMNHKALEALEVENGLRRALAHNEFVLYYQPLIEVKTGAVFGLEALVRWRHPELGLLRPDKFIPAAEQSGLIISIGRWVLREACMQAAEWHSRGHRIVMAVNLSGRQFQDPELLAQVSDALREARLPAEFLELEITEGYAMQDVGKAIQTLQQLKGLGVRIAIDDFGSGYSCLSYLKKFPIDTLKLDGSFVRDLGTPEDAQIALGVIALAHSLRLKVIAEGVETISQLMFLRDHSCDRLQGYLFSRPMPPDNFDHFMAQQDLLKFARSH